MRHRIINNTVFSVLGLLFAVALTSCEKKSSKPPYDLNHRSGDCISVAYEEVLGGKVIPVKLNGIAMSVIYDTGSLYCRDHRSGYGRGSSGRQ